MAQEDGAIVEVAESVLNGIQTHLAEKRHEHSLYMHRCKAINENIRALKDKAKDEGIKRKVLKLLLDDREHERKQDEAASELEHDDQESLNFLRDKLGAFADTPLGQAAMDDVADKPTRPARAPRKRRSAGLSGDDLKDFASPSE